ncbi:MAG TPA: hypothetical protein VFU23_07905 [Gemmatimonadales bacterium]|nr:hypothetical protein [Gemmatimonadales bacterium]
MRSTRVRSWLVLLAAGCSHPQAAAPAPVFSPGVVEEPVTSVITAALDADRRMETADSLWDPDATVIANGELRYAPPRFAGIGAGGEAAITSSRLEVRQTLVWVYLEYRWLSVKDGLARDGKATVLLTPRGGTAGWKIVHLHSSTMP